jgi:hypothetical protein
MIFLAKGIVSIDFGYLFVLVESGTVSAYQSWRRLLSTQSSVVLLGACQLVYDKSPLDAAVDYGQ